MKRLASIATILCVMLAIATADAWGAGSQNARIDNTHPRIILRKGQEKNLMKKIRKDPNWLAVHNKLIASCDELLSKDVEQFKFDVNRKTILRSAREKLRRIAYLSYAYRMTGNKQYLKRAEEEMLHTAAREDWNPKTFLDVAELTTGMAIGYDWLYNDLSPETREKVATAIIEKGLKPSVDKPQWWTKSRNNWNQVCNGGMLLGAIATEELNPELAKQIVERAEASLPLAMSNYAPDGAYPEGPVYWEYGTMFNAMYLSAYENYFGHESELVKQPGFMKTSSYMPFMTSPTYGSFNYSDCGYRAEDALSPSAMWFYSKTKDPVLVFNQQPVLENRNTNFTRIRLLPLAIIWGAGSGLSINNTRTPDQLTYVAGGENGVFTMRSAWGDPDAIFVGLKAGSVSVNHGHMDIGSFVLEANGVRWGADLGKEHYNTIETYMKGTMWSLKQDSPRWTIFRYHNWAHNTLTINGQRQQVDNRVFIDNVSDKPELMYATINLTPIYNRQVDSIVRGIAMVDKKYVVVEDIITTGDQPAKIHWNMTTPATGISLLREERTIILTQRGRRLDVIIDADGAELGKWSARPTDYDPSRTYENPNKGFTLVGYEVTIPANTTRRLKVYLMPSGNDKKPLQVPDRLDKVVE